MTDDELRDAISNIATEIWERGVDGKAAISDLEESLEHLIKQNSPQGGASPHSIGNADSSIPDDAGELRPEVWRIIHKVIDDLYYDSSMAALEEMLNLIQRQELQARLDELRKLNDVPPDIRVATQYAIDRTAILQQELKAALTAGEGQHEQ